MQKKYGRKTIAVLMMVVFTFLCTLGIASQALASYGDSNLRWGSRGTYVQNLQKDLTSLGFNTFGIDGIFGSRTYNAVTSFQKANGLTVDGIAGKQTKKLLSSKADSQKIHVVRAGDTLYKIALKYGTTVAALKRLNNLGSDMIYPGKTLVIPSGGKQYPDNGNEVNYGEPADWWTVVQYVFARGDVAVVTDIDTGISYKVKRKGGTNHADSEPLTAADAAKMKQIYGGYWSWGRRAVLVTVDGRTFAASQNGMPHGSQTIYNNNFNGHFCIHFKNSRTHGTNRVDAAHQNAVRKASGYIY